MRYFTKEWWLSATQNDDAIVSSYAAHFARIRDRLPQALVELSEAHTLHDARVERVACDFTARSVDLVLNGWDIALRHPVRYTLMFTDVTAFDQHLPNKRQAGAELGDLAYWECDLSQAGVELHMLFVAPAEVRIVFRGFRFAAVALAPN